MTAVGPAAPALPDPAHLREQQALHDEVSALKAQLATASAALCNKTPEEAEQLHAALTAAEEAYAVTVADLRMRLDASETALSDVKVRRGRQCSHHSKAPQ